MSDPESQSQPADGELNSPDPADGELEGQQSFDADYVRELREENAARRVELKEAHERREAAVNALFEREIEKHASILRDPEALTAFAKREELMDEETGLPDADKIKAAALDLVAQKPYLDARKPEGDIDQGRKGEPPKVFDLSRMLRDAAG